MFVCVCVCYMHECVPVCMCGACICWRWNPGLQTNTLQTEPHPQPSLIPFLNSCSSHSLLGSGHWTLRSPRPLMIKYLVQCLLHPVASSSEGFGSQDAGRQMGAQALSLLSRLHVWGQCLLWLPPICDFALGTSGVPYLVTGRIKDAQPQWTRELQQILTQGAGTHVTAHTETEGWPSVSDTRCPTQKHSLPHESSYVFLCR